MPTTKIAKKAQQLEKTAMSPRRAKKAVKSRIAKASTRGRDARQVATQYALPAAAVIGTGALTAAGVLMRGRLAEVLAAAAAEGVSLAKHVSFAKVLSFAGLERRRSFFSSAVPSLGALAIGLASGAALAVFFTRTTAPAPGESKPLASEPIAPSPMRNANHDSAYGTPSAT